MHSIIGDILDRKSTRLNSSHLAISYAVFCLKKKNTFAAAFLSPLHEGWSTARGPAPAHGGPDGSRNALSTTRATDPWSACFFFFFLWSGRPPRSPFFPHRPPSH